MTLDNFIIQASVYLVLLLALITLLIAFYICIRCYGAVFVAIYKKKLYALLLLTISLPYLGYKAFGYYCYAPEIPSELKVNWPISFGSEWGFREGCGVAVFRLSDLTLKEIENKGIHYFDTVKKARGYSDHYHTYNTWQETPAPKNWLVEGTWFMCNVIDRELTQQISQAVHLKGAYFTTKDEGQLVVIPSLKLVVFSYYG